MPPYFDAPNSRARRGHDRLARATGSGAARNHEAATGRDIQAELIALMCLANEPAETRVVLRANVAPVRSVPIHSAVMAEGFGAYVASLPPGLLFATVKLDRDGRAGNNASHTLNAWLNEIGITDPRLVFHSWRHTFKTMARAVMTEELHDAITGHSSGSVGRGYGVYSMSVLRAITM